MLGARGYRHSRSGFWYERAARKAFTDQYVRHHNVDQLEADLAQDTEGRPRVYSDRALAPDVAREIERIFAAAGDA